MYVLGMATWASYLIAGGVVVVTVALLYLLYRFGQKSTVKRIMQVSGVVLEGVSNMLEDKKGKVDAHDVLSVVGKLATTAAGAIENPQIKEFSDVKPAIVAFVKDSLKELDIEALQKVPDSVIEKSAEAAFVAAKAIPTVEGAAKK